MILTQKNKLYLNEDDKFIIDKLSYHSARLYNSCNYIIREYYENNKNLEILLNQIPLDSNLGA